MWWYLALLVLLLLLVEVLVLAWPTVIERHGLAGGGSGVGDIQAESGVQEIAR
jgi:hypothetical protein